MKNSRPKVWLIAYLLLFLVSVVLCIRLVHEPDLWWQLRTGEYILEHGLVPEVDVFSYTYEGKPWLNVKWGFEVIQASIVKYFGAEFLPLPQAFANVFIVLCLFLVMRYYPSPTRINRFAKTIGLLLFLIAFSFRMNGRPELTSYLLTSVYLLIFFLHNKGHQKWLWALIPLQIIWANMHEAFGVGLVMIAIFIAAQSYVHFGKKIKSTVDKRHIYTSVLIAFLAWLGTAIHPSGSQMLFHPYEIYTQLSLNQFTAEIYPFTSKAYWKFPAFISMAFFFSAAIHLLNISKNNGKRNLKTLLSKVPLFYLLLVSAFFYLSLKSYRNIPFFIILSLPIVVSFLSSYSNLLGKKLQLGISAIALIAFYFSIVTNSFYNSFLPAEVYGLGVNPAKNTVGAARFLKENGIDGKGFTDYLGSSYLLWDLQPDFKTFVDLRDLDVFDAEDIEIALSCCSDPDRQTASGQGIWDLVNGVYKFNYVCVLNNQAFQNIHLKLNSENDFILVYADELSSVYLKNSSPNKAVITKYGIDGANIPYLPTPYIQPSKLASSLSTLFWPMHKYASDDKSTYLKKRAAYRSYIGFGSMK